MKSSFCIDLQRFMLIPTKFPLSRDSRESGHKVLDGHGRQHVVARDVHVSVRGGGGDGTYQAALVVDAYKPVL